MILAFLPLQPYFFMCKFRVVNSNSKCKIGYARARESQYAKSFVYYMLVVFKSLSNYKGTN